MTTVNLLPCEPEDDPEPSIWTHTLCGIAIMLIVAGFHIATWRI